MVNSYSVFFRLLLFLFFSKIHAQWQRIRREEGEGKLNKTIRRLKVLLLDLKKQTIQEYLHYPVKTKIIPYKKQSEK